MAPRTNHVLPILLKNNTNRLSTWKYPRIRTDTRREDDAPSKSVATSYPPPLDGYPVGAIATKGGIRHTQVGAAQLGPAALHGGPRRHQKAWLPHTRLLSTAILSAPSRRRAAYATRRAQRSLDRQRYTSGLVDDELRDQRFHLVRLRLLYSAETYFNTISTKARLLAEGRAQQPNGSACSKRGACLRRIGLHTTESALSQTSIAKPRMQYDVCAPDKSRSISGDAFQHLGTALESSTTSGSSCRRPAPPAGSGTCEKSKRLLRPIARLQKAARRVRETRPDVEHYGLRQTASCYG